jgi:hypothetical protein
MRVAGEKRRTGMSKERSAGGRGGCHGVSPLATIFSSLSI